MKFLSIALTFITLLISSSFVSASYYYTETSDNIQNYDDSTYLHPDFTPKADLFYTPFNAYRTYCAASYCPVTTKIVYVRETPIKIKQPKLIVVKSYPEPYPISYTYSKFNVYKKPIAPIYLY
jgi:hypothetical protein